MMRAREELITLALFALCGRLLALSNMIARQFEPGFDRQRMLDEIDIIETGIFELEELSCSSCT